MVATTGSKIINEALAADLPRIKRFLSRHESWRDMLAIISSFDDDREVMRETANEVLEQLSTLLEREVNWNKEKITWCNETYSQATATQQSRRFQTRMDELGSILKGFELHDLAIVDHFVFHASTISELEEWEWHPGQSIPDMKDATHHTVFRLSDPLPDNLTCPISQGLMEDPVTATDGKIYDRKNITRWFAMADGRPSSPFTGVVLTSQSLTAVSDVKD